MHFSALLALAGLALGQELSKPAAFPNLDRFRDFTNVLPRQASYSVVPWATNEISKGCRDRVLLDGRDPTKFKAYTLVMADCGLPWFVCREEGAEPSVEQLADVFSRIPIGMRQFVGDVVHFKGGSGASAWQSSILHVSGGSALSVPVWLHEASHCVDGANGIGIQSGSQTWRDAYNRDSHVADNYARTNHAENFAQYAGLVIYDRWSQGGLRALPQYNQLVNQLTRMATAGDGTHSWGSKAFEYIEWKTCGRRWPLTDAVNPRTGAVTKRSDALVPRDVDLQDLVIVPLPEKLVEAPITNCTIGLGV